MKRKQYFIKLTDINRIRVDLLTVRNKINNFVVQLETFVGEKWGPVVRYNYSHGYPHKDVIFANGKRTKEKINETNLAKIVNLAIDDFKSNWENYLGRCGYAEK
ncbi:MAG TPA: hypothetical protein DHV62_02960 [Elusimicrobia bacterium]|nr:hypothetical protein [Elusimicrobiota bacterium]